MNNTFKIRDLLKLKGKVLPDTSIASTFMGVAAKDCKAGDIVTVSLSSSGNYRIFPFEGEEVSYGIIDPEILRFEEEELKKDKKVIAKKKNIVPINL